jgi:6,7-dimethyl-8-ribityllumazine synthase
MAAPDAEPMDLPRFDAPVHVLLLVAPFYRGIADGLLAGARAVLERAGATHETVEVPGALEIAPAIRMAHGTRRFDAHVALGCVIRGETTHYETVCQESARGITLLGALSGVPVGNGILTCETMAQAEARADPARMDKGGGAAAAALHLVALARRFVPPGPETPPPGADTLLASATQLTRTA